MSSEYLLVSEFVTYGFMALNVLLVAFLLWRAWRLGHLSDLESPAQVLFLDEDD